MATERFISQPLPRAQLALPPVDPDGPGFAAMIWQEGAVPLVHCEGLARRGGALIGPDTLFDLASISKMFTALLLHLVIRDKGISTDTALAEILPAMAGAAPGVTLFHLLHHLSGLPDYMDLFAQQSLGPHDPRGMAETLAILAAQPPADPPGAGFTYSNTGYVLLAACIEALTGTQMAALMQDRIFRPLGMSATLLADHMPPRATDLAQSYRSGRGDEVNPLWTMTGDGQIYSNLADMALWIAELSRPRIFAAILPDLMTPPHRPGEDLDYGHGFQHDLLGDMAIIGHDGGWAGFSSALRVAPHYRGGALILTNRADIELSPLIAALMTGHNWS